ncbi:MAG: hypothetical protein WA996_09485, partial [Candidatus Promineifilaceae bacterium]
FKTFRQNEYLTTIERMGCIYYRALASEVLQDEIVITHEVREMVVHPKTCTCFSGFSVVFKDSSYNKCSFWTLFNQRFSHLRGG